MIHKIQEAFVRWLSVAGWSAQPRRMTLQLRFWGEAEVPEGRRRMSRR